MLRIYTKFGVVRERMLVLFLFIECVYFISLTLIC